MTMVERAPSPQVRRPTPSSVGFRGDEHKLVFLQESDAWSRRAEAQRSRLALAAKTSRAPNATKQWNRRPSHFKHARRATVSRYQRPDYGAARHTRTRTHRVFNLPPQPSMQVCLIYIHGLIFFVTEARMRSAFSRAAQVRSFRCYGLSAS